MISPRKLPAALLGCIVSLWGYSQPFSPDSAGYVAAPAFKTFLKTRGYQVSGAYRWIDGHKVAIMAKNGEYDRIGLDGKEVILNLDRAQSVGGDDWHPRETPDFIAPGTPKPTAGKVFALFTEGAYTGVTNNESGDVVLTAEFDECVIAGAYAILARKGDLWTLYGLSFGGEVRYISDPYRRILMFELPDYKITNRFAVQTETGKWGLLDDYTKEVIPAIYDTVVKSARHYDLYAVELNGKMGMIDNRGEWILETMYDDIVSINDKISAGIRQTENGKAVTLFNEGFTPSDREYSDYTVFGKNILCVQVGAGTDKKLGFFSTVFFNEITPPVYSSVGKLIDGVAIVSVATPEGERYGYVSVNGTELLAPVYEAIKPLDENIAVVKGNGRYGAVNLRGDTLIPFRYEDLAVLHPGNHHDFGFQTVARYTFLQAGKWGALSSTGKTVLEPLYDKVVPCDTDYMVTSKGLTGVVSSTNKIRIPLIHQTLQYSQPGLYEIVRGGQLFLIDYYGGEMKLNY